MLKKKKRYGGCVHTVDGGGAVTPTHSKACVCRRVLVVASSCCDTSTCMGAAPLVVLLSFGDPNMCVLIKGWACTGQEGILMDRRFGSNTFYLQVIGNKTGWQS